MAIFNPETTWLGLLGGGISGSIIGGGSVYQIDLWHMGGLPVPVRVLVTGKRLGVIAELTTAIAALVVTGCRTAKDMDGLTDTGIDWEFAVGVSGKSLVKSGAELFKIMASTAAKGINWAGHESAKRFVQWTMNDLGIVQSDKAFNLIPSPLSLGVGAGIFYDWQTLHVLGGKVGWEYISPIWNVENSHDGVRLQMQNIPEQDGEVVHIGLSVPEWGIDPYIRWKKDRGGAGIEKSDLHIDGYVYEGTLYEGWDAASYSGINLSNYLPVGLLESGFWGVENTETVNKSAKLTVQPNVMRFGNYAYWSARDSMTVKTDGYGRFKKYEGATKWKK